VTPLEHDGQVVQIDADGCLVDPTQWTPEIAEALARRAGIAALTDLHWKIIALCREEAARRGRTPDARSLSSLSGLDIGELRQLFSDEPARLAARVAGLSVTDPAAAPENVSEEEQT
jgi:tRNA 2-thiouridine synthesizing protein E